MSASAVLIPVAPALALSVAAIFVVTLGIDLDLLRRQVLLAERSMTATFRSRRPERPHLLRKIPYNIIS
jgi:hypothetical protein